MGTLKSLLYGIAVGAGLMYFLDPNSGDRRKAMVRDQAVRARARAKEGVDTGIRDLRHRVKGLLAEGMAMVDEQGVSDQVLEERVRSRLGFITRHPGAVQVTVRDKTAVLSGDALANEAPLIASGLMKMRGLKNVENKLRVHETAENIPQLQSEGWMPGDGGRMWSPSTRLLAGIGAAYLLISGMLRGGFLGTLSKAGGVLLGARAIGNNNLKSLIGMGQEQEAVRVRKTININAPVEEVYGLWSNFENFAQFMSHIDEIRDMGSGRSHWVVKGPAGTKVEFDAIMTENKPNEVVAWKTTEDSTVKHHGQVRFKESEKMGTQVNVNMAYTPPAGVVGHTVASAFGVDPKTSMDEDLVKMKSLLEEGKTTASGQKVKRDQVSGKGGGGKSGGGGSPSRSREESTTGGFGVIPTTGSHGTGDIESDVLGNMDSTTDLMDRSAGTSFYSADDARDVNMDETHNMDDLGDMDSHQNFGGIPQTGGYGETTDIAENKGLDEVIPLTGGLTNIDNRDINMDETHNFDETGDIDIPDLDDDDDRRI